MTIFLWLIAIGLAWAFVDDMGSRLMGDLWDGGKRSRQQAEKQLDMSLTQLPDQIVNGAPENLSKFKRQGRYWRRVSLNKNATV